MQEVSAGKKTHTHQRPSMRSALGVFLSHLCYLLLADWQYRFTKSTSEDL